MTRLTNEIRDYMTRDILLHANRERGEQLCRLSNDLFATVHADNYDNDTLALMGKLLKRHKSAFEHRKSRSINVAGYRIDIGDQRIGYSSVRFQVDAPVTPVISGIESNIVYSDCNIALSIKDFAEQRRDFEADVKAQWERLRATFTGISTGKQLADQWPEAMPLIAKYIPEKRGQLPAIPFGRLNDEFRLPPAEIVGVVAGA